MDIKLNKVDDTQGALVVNVQEKDYQDRVEQKLKEYAKKASIKGFRPGKVPVGMIRKMYGKSILVDEINNLLSESVDKYLKEQDIKYIGRPLPDTDQAEKIDWNEQTDFEFSYDLGLVPEFKLELSRAKVDKYIIKHDKKMVDETIENVRKQNATSEKVDVSKEGDFISGKLIGENFEKEVMLPTSQVKKDKKQFIGVKSDDVIEFDLQKVFGKDESAISYFTGLEKEEAAKLSGKYTLTVESVSRSVEPELNQELFDKTFGQGTVKSEEEFRNKIEETIKENYEREANNLLNRKIMDKLIEKTKLDLSRDFLTRFIKASNDQLSDKEIEESIEDYIRDLKWTLIRNEFMKEEKVEVSNDEVVEAARGRLMSQFNLPGLTPEMAEQFAPIVDNYLKEDNGRNYMNEYENLLTGKVLDKMRDHVAVKEKKVSVEDFNKEVQKMSS